MFDEFGNPVDAYDTNYGPNESWGGGDMAYGGDDFGDGGGGLLPVQFGGLGGIAGRAGSLLGGPVARAGGAMMRRGGSIVTAAGRRISTSKAWAIAKRYGPDVAASAVGMGLADFLAVMMDSGAMTRRHRRRGISSRDFRTTRRVVNFVNRLTHTLGCVSSPRRHFRRGSGSASASARAR